MDSSVLKRYYVYAGNNKYAVSWPELVSRIETDPRVRRFGVRIFRDDVPNNAAGGIHFHHCGTGCGFIKIADTGEDLLFAVSEHLRAIANIRPIPGHDHDPQSTERVCVSYLEALRDVYSTPPVVGRPLPCRFYLRASSVDSLLTLGVSGGPGSTAVSMNAISTKLGVTLVETEPNDFMRHEIGSEESKFLGGKQISAFALAESAEIDFRDFYVGLIASSTLLLSSKHKAVSALYLFVPN